MLRIKWRCLVDSWIYVPGEKTKLQMYIWEFNIEMLFKTTRLADITKRVNTEKSPVELLCLYIS